MDTNTRENIMARHKIILFLSIEEENPIAAVEVAMNTAFDAFGAEAVDGIMGGSDTEPPEEDVRRLVDLAQDRGGSDSFAFGGVLTREDLVPEESGYEVIHEPSAEERANGA